MMRPASGSNPRSTQLLVTLPQPERERLRLMVEATTGAESLAALVRRHLADGLAQDAQRLKRLRSEIPAAEPPLSKPTRRALLARKNHTHDRS